MNGHERRTAIVKAVLPVFAKNGFANTTTRELAEAAGVSEALLYKHFPSKDLLYAEIKNFGCRAVEPAYEKVAGLEPSTSTLVCVVYYLMRCVAIGRRGDFDGWETRHRLVMHSCLEDGAFPRYLFQSHFTCFWSKIEACLNVAQRAGDLVAAPVTNSNKLRFAHHLACMIAIVHLPSEPVIDYEVSREELLRQAVWFVLRGIGLTDGAIKLHYNAKALSLFAD